MMAVGIFLKRLSQLRTFSATRLPPPAQQQQKDVDYLFKDKFLTLLPELS